MFTKASVQMMALGLIGSFAASASAQDSGALIDALVRKGILRDQEAEQIRSQLTRDFAANSSAGKLNLTSSVKEFKLSGDVRLRTQYDQSQDQTAAAAHDSQRLRYRLRLRVNGDYQLSENFFAGFGLQTENKPDSGNQTMADPGTATPGAGFQNYNVYVSKAYVGWRPVPGVSLIAGKQANPFYTTDLIWDSDINPAGFVERLDLNKFLSLGEAEVSLIGGQFILQDNTESVNPGAGGDGWKRDAYLYQTQLLTQIPLSKGMKLTLAPGLMFTNGGAFHPSTAANALGVTAALNPNENAVTLGGGSTTLDGEMILLAPGDVAFSLFGMKTKFQWDFAFNFDGRERWDLVAPTKVGDARFIDKTGWLAGFQLGENKKKGDWSVLANYRMVGGASIDPNINDSDWALSKLNMQGYKAALAYNLGEAATLTFSYYSGNNIRKNLSFTGADRNSVQVFQLDAQIKF